MLTTAMASFSSEALRAWRAGDEEDARERAVRGRGRGSRHADGARARIEGDDASSIGDGGDESTRGDDDDDDDDQGVVANDGVVGERE